MPNRATTLSQIKRQTATPVKDHRPSAAKRGYGARWQKYRKYFLSINPLCIICKNDNMITSATVVDHIVPHKGDMVKFWDKSNHQALCKCHHDIKTASEDGGFGHKIKEKV
jgi:5-methylcytosine-specific restriction protein A